jgi:hypothetical protein
MTPQIIQKSVVKKKKEKKKKKKKAQRPDVGHVCNWGSEPVDLQTVPKQATPRKPLQ